MDILYGPDLKNGHSHYGKRLVGWSITDSVNLAKWAKMAISEQIWLKFGMYVLNGPRFEKW